MTEDILNLFHFSVDQVLLSQQFDYQLFIKLCRQELGREKAIFRSRLN